MREKEKGDWWLAEETLTGGTLTASLGSYFSDHWGNRFAEELLDEPMFTTF